MWTRDESMYLLSKNGDIPALPCLFTRNLTSFSVFSQQFKEKTSPVFVGVAVRLVGIAAAPVLPQRPCLGSSGFATSATLSTCFGGDMFCLVKKNGKSVFHQSTEWYRLVLWGQVVWDGKNWGLNEESQSLIPLG